MWHGVWDSTLAVNYENNANRIIRHVRRLPAHQTQTDQPTHGNSAAGLTEVIDLGDQDMSILVAAREPSHYVRVYVCLRR